MFSPPSSFLSTPVAETPALTLFKHLENQLNSAMNRRETQTQFHKPSFTQIQEQPWEDYDDEDNHVYRELNEQQVQKNKPSRLSEPASPPQKSIPEESSPKELPFKRNQTRKLSLKQLSSAGPSSENLNRLSPKNDSDG